MSGGSNGAGSAPRSSQGSSGGERRRVTVLFADMVDFTPTAERLGEEGAYNLMQRIFTLMSTTVREHGGIVETFTGDGIMALFGLPVALEDATLRACKAGLRIQARLAAEAEELAAEFGARPRLRIGINSGPVVAGQLEGGRGGVSGDTINLASRLQALAAPDTVVLSEAAHQFVRGLVEAPSIGQHKIKGKAEPQTMYRLDGMARDAVRFDAALSRGLTDYVGRKAELETLAHTLSRAGGSLQVVDLVGEPGMGKSRLLHEFLATLDPGMVALLKGNCTSDGTHAAFGMFIDVVRAAFRLAAGDVEADIARKLTDGLSLLGLHSPENQGLLLNLLGLRTGKAALGGLDGTLIGLRTRALLQALLHARCQFKPTVMVLEDLHWIDSGSEELLARILATETDLPLMVVHTRRPEYTPPWQDSPGLTTLSLARLSGEETERVVQNRLKRGALPRRLAAFVRERADGNALFAEEIASFLVERGAVRGSGTQLEFDEGAVANILPPSVQSLLAARVDTLPPDDRRLLQAASVIGRSFDPDLLGHVIDEPDVTDRLEAIARQDFLTIESRTGDYVFKHALLRDALYESLLSGARAALHLKVAEEIERRSGNRLAEMADALALHFAQTREDAKAFVYVAMAARKSLGTYALPEAGAYYRQAAALLDRAAFASDDAFADFLTGAILCQQLSYEPREIVGTMDKYRERFIRLGDRVEAVVALHYEVWALIWLLRIPDAARVQALAEAMTNRLGDDKSRAYTEAGFFFLDAVLGAATEGTIARGEAAVAVALMTRDAYITAWLRFTIAWNAFHRGYVAHARALGHDLMRTGSEMRDPRSTGLALWLQCWTAIIFDDFEEALRHADTSIEQAITPFDRWNCIAAKGSALILLRRPDEGVPLVAEARAEAARHERNYEFIGNDFTHGIGIVLQGRFAEGVRHIEAAIARRDGEGYRSAAEWYRLGLSQLYLDILEGADKPPLTIVLRNIRFLVATMIGGRRKVLGLLRRIETNPVFSDESFHTGQLHFLFGRCCLQGKNKVAAVEHFRKSKRVLERHGATTMLRKVDQAIAANA